MAGAKAQASSRAKAAARAAAKKRAAKATTEPARPPRGEIESAALTFDVAGATSPQIGWTQRKG